MTSSRVRRGIAAPCAALILLGTALLGAPPASGTPGDFLIVGGNQATNQLIAYDPSVSDWTSPSATKWTWTPTSTEGFSSAELTASQGISGFKLRDWGSGQRVVFTSGNGLAAIITAPPSGGTKVWSVVVPAADNPHAAELLPNGNLAVTATGNDNTTDHGWVRIYAASQGPSDTNYASYALYDVHGAWWDPTVQRLWVIGREGPLDPNTGQPTGARVLTALAITGSPAQPHVTQDAGRRVVLPDIGEHDVNIDPTNPNVLLLTTANHTYSYNDVTNTFTTLSNLTFVKALSEQPSGQLVQTQADAAKTPPGPCASVNNWCTDTVNFFNPTFNRTVPGAQFYRAYTWNPSYNSIGDTLSGPVNDRTLLSGGGWSTPTTIDTNGAIASSAAAALPGGTLHVLTLVPGSGVWDRTFANNTWSPSATQIDNNGAITAVTAAALPNGTLHVETVVPGYGVYDRSLDPTTHVWGSASQIDSNGAITTVAATALPDGTLHVQTLVPGSGIYDRSLNPSTHIWGSASQIVAGCPDSGQNTACVGSIASAAAGSTLHVEYLIPANGIFDLNRNSSGQWSSPTQIDFNTMITSIAAAATPTGTLHVQGVVPGAGLWDRNLPSGGSWSSATQVDPNIAIFGTYSAVTPDGTLHVGSQAYP